jgi:hypothetical protein
MTSAINPNNIDGAYPVAGQDNNSQGFRDNFTNTKTNFQYAAEEITELQNKAVLKAALTGTTLNNDMLGSVLSNAQLQDMSETRVSLGTLSSTVVINYMLGSVQTVTTAGSISLSFTNWPAAGAAGLVQVQITVTNPAYTVTLPAAVSVNVTGIQGYSNNVITFATGGVYSFNFSTSNGGSTIAISETNKQIQPYNNSQEDLADAATISLATTYSYFTTAAAETATLPDGAEGQVKVLVAKNVAAGDMVVSVDTSGWGGSTITFDGTGQTATVTWLQGAWYVTGTGADATNNYPTIG